MNRVATNSEGTPIAVGEVVLDEDGNIDAVGVTGNKAKPTLSATALGNYEVCGFRGQCYHDLTIPKGPAAPNMIRGSVWHMMMEWWNIQHKANGHEFKVFFPDLDVKLGDVMVEGISQHIEINAALWKGVNPEAYQDFITEMLDVTKDLAHMLGVFVNADDNTHWTLPGVEVVAHEELLYVEDFCGVPVDFVGYADAVLRVPGVVGVVGVDYKATGKAWGGAKGAGDPRKIIQPPLYAEAWEQMHNEPMDWFVMDVMTKAGKFQRVWVPTNEQVRAPFLTRWRNVAEDMLMHRAAGMDMPTNPSHFLCSADYCDYWQDICPMGSQLSEAIEIQIGGRP